MSSTKHAAPLRIELTGPRGWSISTKLAIWYGSTIMVLLTAFAVVTYITFDRSQNQDFDQHLMHEMTVLLPLVEFGESGPSFSRFEAMRGIAYQTDGVFGTYVRLLDDSGAVLYESPNLDGHAPLPMSLPAEPVESVVASVWQEAPLRSHFHPLFGSDTEHVGWLEVSGFEWSMHQELDRLASTLAFGILMAFLLSIAGGYLLARRSLRPVVAITDVADEIRASSLHRRIPTDVRVQDELSHLADTINALLERIEASFHRERRFSANAAHELITPLAAIRAEIELAVRSANVEVENSAGLEMALLDIDRMNATVRSLLQLSSVERLEETEFELIDVRTVVSEHVARFEDRASVEGRFIECSLGLDCMVVAHRDGLGTVLDNLIENAIKYTESGGRIEVNLKRAADQVEIIVQDDGVGFETEEAARLFDRFYRGNRVQSDRVGSGIGLAIVQAIVRRFGGVASAKSAGLGLGARFVVSLPAALDK